MSTLNELRKKDASELDALLIEQRTELLELRFSHATGALENSARLSHVKREIARTLTVVNEQRHAGVAAGK